MKQFVAILAGLVPGSVCLGIGEMLGAAFSTQVLEDTDGLSPASWIAIIAAWSVGTFSATFITATISQSVGWAPRVTGALLLAMGVTMLATLDLSPWMTLLAILAFPAGWELACTVRRTQSPVSRPRPPQP